ncbi:MAG: hypothetical protein ACHQYP_03560 [Nitrospiria bacterium]
MFVPFQESIGEFKVCFQNLRRRLIGYNVFVHHNHTPHLIMYRAKKGIDPGMRNFVLKTGARRQRLIDGGLVRDGLFVGSGRGKHQEMIPSILIYQVRTVPGLTKTTLGENERVPFSTIIKLRFLTSGTGFELPFTKVTEERRRKRIGRNTNRTNRFIFSHENQFFPLLVSS